MINFEYDPKLVAWVIEHMHDFTKHGFKYSDTAIERTLRERYHSQKHREDKDVQTFDDMMKRYDYLTTQIRSELYRL